MNVLYEVAELYSSTSVLYKWEHLARDWSHASIINLIIIFAHESFRFTFKIIIINLCILITCNIIPYS